MNTEGSKELDTIASLNETFEPFSAPLRGSVPFPPKLLSNLTRKGASQMRAWVFT